MRFKKLRLSGFKSFVDATELLIEQGLTGVVGPNGCGKSNLVEALRWAMGETSAKQMRGDEMDDVIFGGTNNRPARNIAEVTLHLDNADRRAPAQFNHFDELEISRRIERQKGSTYRVNGKETRARDVQLLFADAATGARSTALVSQGRIGAVISAKPTQRRMLLEEAAGITGLHSRRHEAELRLRGAESNLERLDDVLVTLDAQMTSLKKQARQASRYRNLSDHIRTTEATLYHLRWTRALDELDTARAAFQAAESRVNELTGLTSQASTRQAEEASVVPHLRQAEAEAAAALQRLTLERESLDQEEQRLEQQRLDLKHRQHQAQADAEREQALAQDADQAMARLVEEREAVEAARQGEETAQQEAAEALEAANVAVSGLEAKLNELTEKVAADEARRSNLTHTRDEALKRVERLQARLEEVAEQRAALEAEAGDQSELEEAAEALAAAEEAAEAAHGRVEAAEARRAEAGEAVVAAQADLQEVQGRRTGLKAEEKALADLLDSGGSDLFPSLIDAVTVEPGLEAALGAALGEELSAPADEPAPVHWRTLAPFAAPPALPDGATALAGHVQAPPALARRLSQVGVVTDQEAGDRLAPRLAQGQRLVSRDGGLWRWDGYTVAAGAPTAEAARLEQRNRLQEIREQLAGVEAEEQAAEEALAAARTRAEDAAAAEKQARDSVREAEAAHARARETLAGLKEQAARQNSRLQSLAETAESIETDLAEARRESEEAAEALETLPDLAEARERVGEMRTELAERRAVQVDRQAAYNNLVREAEQRRQRLEAIDRELESWRDRQSGASDRLAHLAERRETIAEELEALTARPAEIADRRQALLDQIEQAEAKRKEAADKLAEAEGRLAEVEKGLRTAEAELAKAREERVRAEGTVEQCRQTCRSIAERIAEKLECRPEDTAEVAGLKDDEPLPDLEQTEKRLERLQRERETMGPVNLRAEQEMQELTEQIDTMTAEREDLVKAIDKLRKGIAELNQEGRERLMASYREVDAHFQELFVRLFGGGRAHLTLTESDDPLEAGLEIMASPPGKRLQVLSLLSGGEQALTALALLFGVFMTNPAPICVLDEVDAPLDDANVDRFCTLLEEMAHSGDTRFLVITHHRMTMARMDRLFGVTMGERGVSQLVSVDLRQAERLRESA